MIENKQKKRTNIKLYTYIIFLALAAMMLMFYLFKTYTISDYVLLVVFLFIGNSRNVFDTIT